MFGNVLFNDTLNTFYLRLYGIRHMVKDHSDSEKGNLLLPHKPRLHCHKSRGLDPGRARLGKKGGSVNVSTGLGPVLLSGGPSPVGRGRLGPGRARLGT